MKGMHILLSDPSTNKNNNMKVFDGATDSNDQFGDMLRKLVKDGDPTLIESLGAAADNLGTHSVRKGACTETSSQPQRPDPDAISLRMDHELARSKGIYKMATTGYWGFIYSLVKYIG